ncbi:hypothetical protein PSTG_09464 [Puccinia striiformis f. sp. tritici PST-78]|uniref:NADH-cytochrome b5 reductase n=1 Tax=Puccinia striiformis f. sp. tritici PST-78 TaxID=1165861 RepID=A0A0L0VD22_9BASI|nr:hypothetical protein PSTG_09464 [Puccinia striiformis f. sp. tritici PST-78]
MWILLLVILLATGIPLLIRHRNKPKPALIKNQFQNFRLASKKTVSPNTSIYRFALNNQNHYLGLPIGQHLLIQAEINGKQVQRMYTPVSSDDDKGYFELMIKTYEQGNISKLIAELKIGESIQVKGPRGQMKYHRDLCDQIGMIAGGTGITPMMQIIRACIKDQNDRTMISLIYANVNPDDILLKHELDTIAEEHPDKFKVYYVLNNPPDQGWAKGGTGYVTKEMIEHHLPSSKLGDRVKILLCGPPPMISIMKKYLDELAFEKPRVISKLEDQVFCF